MDAKQFVAAIEPGLRRRLKDFQLRILRNNLPTSVSFLVTSKEFQDVSRWARIEFMANLVEDTFGLPLEFGPGGLALTPEEADEMKPWERDDSSDWTADIDSEDPAAAPTIGD